MIKIGIEASRNKLRCDLLEHPERYFFILAIDSNASFMHSDLRQPGREHPGTYN